MLTIILIISIITVLLVALIFAGIRLMPRIIRGIIREEVKAMSERLNRLRLAVLAQTTVVAGVATAFAGLTAQVKEQADALREAGADTTDLDATIAAIEANNATLAQAVAVDTTASDEVHQDDGGTGDDVSAVVPEPAPLPDDDGGDAGEGEGAGEGSDAGAGEGAGDDGDGSGDGSGAEGEGEGAAAEGEGEGEGEQQQ